RSLRVAGAGRARAARQRTGVPVDRQGAKRLDPGTAHAGGRGGRPGAARSGAGDGRGDARRPGPGGSRRGGRGVARLRSGRQARLTVTAFHKNGLQYRGIGDHVESFFVKATAPDAKRALWLKATVVASGASPETA